MKIAIASVAGAVAALVAASMLGVAAAEAPTTTPARTVNVQGVATVPIDTAANASQANAAYRQGMAAAVSDGQGKAEFLAGKAGAALGPVQSIVEEGGYISCTGGEEQYAEYRGEQPDFGSSQRSVAPLSGASSPTVAPHARLPHRRHPARRQGAKTAAAVSCALRTQVSLSYALG
jgi:hypothetical protein